MEIPKTILEVYDTVDFCKYMDGEKIELSGIVTKVNKDQCMHKRTLRDLTYEIKEDGCNTFHTNVSHEDVQETIMCPNCGCDILEYGVEEKVWKIHRYNKHSKENYNEFCNVCDGPYFCSCCGYELDKKSYNKLKRYLSI